MTKQNFSRKILDRLERIDREQVEAYLTELVRENERHIKILQSLDEGLLLANGGGTITFVNESLLSLFQETKAAVEGKPLEEFLARQGLNTQDILKNLIDDRQTLSKDFFLEKPAAVWVRLYAIPILDADGVFAGSCITFKDITRWKQQEEQQRHAQRLNTLVPLAAGLAHEIGNPLNSLDIHIQLAERELRDLPENKKKKIGKNLEVAKDEIKRLDRIVTQFLGALRPLKANFKLKNLNELLDATLDFMAPEISLAKVTVERRFQTHLPPTLVDEDQLKQAFFNIIKNAVQAMPRGGQLRVQTEVKNQTVRIAFSDTGVGIPSERLQKIFEPYYSTKEKGTGLGLVIVSRIVNEHGGSIQVKSTPEKGTQFVVLLPLASPGKRLLPQTPSAGKGRKPKKGAA